MVFEESRLESKIRYSDPEVTLIRDNKKMSDFCVQDRKCAFGKEKKFKKKEKTKKKKKRTSISTFTHVGICSEEEKISQKLAIKPGSIRTGGKANITSESGKNKEGTNVRRIVRGV